MGKIFISYRRDDSNEVTGRIFDHLSQKFNSKNIFKDVDSIPLGSNFKETIETSVQSCEVILAIIGDKWSTISDDSNNRRIDDKNDFVRIEIEAGLSRGIPVIPVLVSGARMPTIDELPASLQNLAFQNGLPVRPDPDFKNDINKLSKSLKRIINPKTTKNKKIALLALLVSIPIIYLAINNGYPTRSNAVKVHKQPPSNQQSNEQKTTTKLSDTKEIKAFDVKGIELGMTPEEVKSKAPYSYDNLKEVKKDGITAYFTMFSVKNFSHESPEELSHEGISYTFDKRKKLINLLRRLKYGLSTEPSPNWEKIDSDIFAKYGQPHFSGNYSYEITPNTLGNNTSYCWGGCYLEKSSGGTQARPKSKGKQLIISRRLQAVIHEGERKHYHYLSFDLSSREAYLKAITIRKKLKHEGDIDL